jgi:PPE-repeat protein
MDFASLPPETNSGRMHSGPGSQSLISAAGVWDELAASLHDTAAHLNSLPHELSADWQPYMDWLNDVAAQAAHTAARAKSAAAAYELALASTVPPAAIEANRMLRDWLAETNGLGQSSAAIAEAESDYDQMWAQDVDTMYTYAKICADAVAVTPFAAPPPVLAGVADTPSRWKLAAAPDVITAGAQVLSAIPATLEGLVCSPPAAFDTFLLPVSAPLSKLSSLCGHSDLAINHLNAVNKQAALASAAAISSRLPGRGRGATSGFGRAATVGALSVPRSWPAATLRAAAAEPQRPQRVNAGTPRQCGCSRHTIPRRRQSR